jgi:hypothetical protein
MEYLIKPMVYEGKLSGETLGKLGETLGKLGETWGNDRKPCAK